MHCILSGVKITDPTSQYNTCIKDIRIKDGTIVEIADAIDTAEVKKYDFKGKRISPGWFDLLASFGDPGHEQKEDLETGALAAMQGGYTAVCIMPDTSPCLHSKAEIEYIINKSRNYLVQIYPLGAVTKNNEGKDLTDIYDMYHAGAIGFTDAPNSVYDAGILLRSLQYIKPFNGTLINIPCDHRIVGNANLNEGMMSMQLGMYGIPDILEELMVIRDIKLAEYTNSNIHLGIISSAKSIAHIREAKRKGIKISASVSAYHLYFDEHKLFDYDARYKVNPPLRTAEDIASLTDALKDGTIDAICSYHIPHEADVKDVEFEYAAFGMETLEATFASVNKLLHKLLSPEELISKISINPRKIIGVDIPSIQENNKAELTIFDTDSEWVFSEKDIYSKSKNTGFIGELMKGKAVAVINKNQIKILQ